ncbi:MAG: ferrochelatase [Deltaproteobacteria bacterium]|nr:ferrochelatase [Deltaproteobacteria bacterium]
MNGLLLINLGTPDEPTPSAVRRYLREFLSDPRVLDINPIGRAALLNLVILPTRPSKSAEAYQQIWTERGSPLLFHSVDLTEKVTERLGDGWRVELAMRYGNPSIEAALERFRKAGITRLVVLPLFPQYASSSTGSALEVVYKHVAESWNTPYLTVVPPYFDDPLFIEGFRAVGQPILDDKQPDYVLMSFHGLPERHMRKSDHTGAHCLSSPGCCDQMSSANSECYRAQCFATARALAAALDLEDGKWEVTFQSRLGRTPWIKPYTDEVLVELPKRGIKKLAVFCPAFVADCLETLEEIGMRADEDFREAGGEELTLVPSLNSSDAWADAVAALARREAPEVERKAG